MIGRVIFSSFLVLLFFSCKNNEGLFFLEGKVSGVTNNKLYVVQLNADSHFLTDTILLNEDGSFKYMGNADSLTIILLMEDKSSWIPLFVNSGYNVRIDTKSSCLNLAEISGGKMNEHLNNFRRRTMGILEKKCEIEHVMTDVFNDENYYASDIILLEQLRPNLANLNHSLGVQAERYVKDNPEGIENIALLLDIFCRGNNYEKLQRSLSMLKGPAKQFYLTAFLLNLTNKMQQVGIGQKAPDFTMNDVSGKKVSLSDYEGKYLLLHFWTTEEPFSRASNRYYLNEVYLESIRKKSDSRFCMLGVCLDDDEMRWRRTIAEDSMCWDNVCDLKGLNSEILASYGMFVNGSKNFLIDPNGIIIAQDVKSGDVLSMIH